MISQDQAEYFAIDISRLKVQLGEAERANSELRRDTFTILHSLMCFRYAYKSLHSYMTGIWSRRTAEAMSFETSFCDDLHAVALIHDIGMLGLPDKIIEKKKPFSSREEELIRMHPRIGALMIPPSTLDPQLILARGVILYHHENYDGSGYPFGLSHENIPIEARIIRVTDVFESLLHPRPDRAALSRAEAMTFIVNGRGSLFDPLVAEAFLDNIDFVLAENPES